MKISKDEVVARLRGMGRDEEADRALDELPNHVDVHMFETALRGYGLDPEHLKTIAPPPGPFL